MIIHGQFVIHPYLTLEEEIDAILNLDAYHENLEEAFNQQKSQIKNQIMEPK